MQDITAEARRERVFFIGFPARIPKPVEKCRRRFSEAGEQMGSHRLRIGILQTEKAKKEIFVFIHQHERLGASAVRRENVNKTALFGERFVWQIAHDVRALSQRADASLGDVIFIEDAPVFVCRKNGKCKNVK